MIKYFFLKVIPLETNKYLEWSIFFSDLCMENDYLPKKTNIKEK